MSPCFSRWRDLLAFGRKLSQASFGQAPVGDALRISRKGNRRLFERYNRLVDAGKGANKAKVATASEETCWIWRIGLEVQASLA